MFQWKWEQAFFNILASYEKDNQENCGSGFRCDGFPYCLPFCGHRPPGFIIGYLSYGTIHYAIHAWNPPFKWMKPLWTNHHLHHYKDDHHGFGVSSTFWDHVFGTMFDLKNIKVDKEKIQALKFQKEGQLVQKEKGQLEKVD